MPRLNRTTCFMIASWMAVGMAQLPAPERAEGKVERKTAALWKSIDYPMVDIPSAPGEKCWLTVMSGAGAKADDQPLRLRIAVGWSGQDGKPQPEAMRKPEQMSVRLRRGNGTIGQPLTKFVAGPSIGMSGGQSTCRSAEFSWGENALEEAWFELRIDERVYWLEVPYGFTRDPLAPLAPAIPAAGPGKPPATSKQFSAHDRVVPWSRIEFDLGTIQNGWRLSAATTNGEGARWSTTLYRETGPWNFKEALTWPRILDEDDGTRLDAKHLGSDTPDPFRRIDRFSFEEYIKEGRGWGTLIVTVDDKPNVAIVPSSLFARDHAAAGRFHPLRIVTEPQR